MITCPVVRNVIMMFVVAYVLMGCSAMKSAFPELQKQQRVSPIPIEDMRQNPDKRYTVVCGVAISFENDRRFYCI